MRVSLFCGVSLLLAFRAQSAEAQERFVPVTPLVTIGRPQPMASAGEITPASDPRDSLRSSRGLELPRPTFRAQSPDFPPMQVPPPPPPPPGFAPGGAVGGPAVFPGGPVGVRPDQEAYNCGHVTNDADLGGFWTRTGDRFRRCWTDVTGAVGGGLAGTGGRSLFQSDHEFDSFISPVTNPVFFEDPRALTELRPGFIWQRTRDETPYWAGGDNYVANLQARVAFTPWISLVINKLGWTWTNPQAPVAGVVEEASGFSEIHLGPKVTFIRNCETHTIAALGLNFELPVGSERVLQSTGNLSLSPYFSFAQKFWCSEYGAFNFMNTTGYSLGVDSKRTDFLYVSAHLDYNVMNANKFYPLVELNWTRYTFNGSERTFGFEGSNLFNFGSDGVAGQDELTVAIGARYAFSPNIQIGLAGEMSVLGGARHMDDFRITADMIFRY